MAPDDVAEMREGEMEKFLENSRGGVPVTFIKKFNYTQGRTSMHLESTKPYIKRQNF